MSTVNKEQFQKSLAHLKSMAKAQLHHTGSDSNPGDWAGTSQEDCDEHESKVDVNGTDYNGVRKSLAAKIRKSMALTPAEVAIADGKNPRKLLATKISKGGVLTAAEQWVLKGHMDKGFPMAEEDDYEETMKGDATPGASSTPGTDDDASNVPDTHGGKDTSSEVEPDAKKSLGQHLDRSKVIQKGFEISPFLYELTNALGSVMSDSEARVIKSLAGVITGLNGRIASLEKSLSASQSDQGTFNKSLAEAVVGIGEAQIGGSNAALQAARLPVGAPKSQFRTGAGNGVQALQKSVGPGGLDMDLSKSQVVNAMTDMVEKGLLNGMDVIRYEGNGEISSEVLSRVSAHISGGDR